MPVPSRLLLFGCLLALAACGADPQVRDEAGEKAQVEAVLHAQQAAWNRGDLAGFMDGYWHSDSLRFASGGTVRHGWQTTLDGYTRGYPDRNAMGTLAFDSLDVRLLGPDDAYVFGRWALARDTAFAPASGLFTLILRRTPQGWRVVHDHTSSAR